MLARDSTSCQLLGFRPVCEVCGLLSPANPAGGSRGPPRPYSSILIMVKASRLPA
jgi:hypothetical protein